MFKTLQDLVLREGEESALRPLLKWPRGRLLCGQQIRHFTGMQLSLRRSRKVESAALSPTIPLDRFRQGLAADDHIQSRARLPGCSIPFLSQRR